MIYFARIGDDGPIKIGVSEGVEGRMIQLENHYARPLTLLKVLPGGVEEERAMHERFAHLRYRRTEQFRPSPELLEFIGRPLFATMDPDVVEVVTPKGFDPERDDVVAKIDRTIVGKAKLIATHEGTSVAQLLSELLAGPVDKRYVRMIRRMEGRPEA